MSECIELGHGHEYRFTIGDLSSFPDLFPDRHVVTGDRECGIVGIIESHTTPAGNPCEGTVPFCRPLRPSEYEAKQAIWQVQSLAPLTISPSVHCTAEGCGAHGFIRGDKWIPA